MALHPNQQSLLLSSNRSIALRIFWNPPLVAMRFAIAVCIAKLEMARQQTDWIRASDLNLFIADNTVEILSKESDCVKNRGRPPMDSIFLNAVSIVSDECCRRNGGLCRNEEMAFLNPRNFRFVGSIESGTVSTVIYVDISLKSCRYSSTFTGCRVNRILYFFFKSYWSCWRTICPRFSHNFSRCDLQKNYR